MVKGLFLNSKFLHSASLHQNFILTESITAIKRLLNLAGFSVQISAMQIAKNSEKKLLQ